MLKNFWYAVEFSEDVTNKPKEMRCLGQRFVMYRTQGGEVVCLSDLCVHRGGRLSGGWLSNDCIVCPYHGWQYQADGACVKIPANPPDRGVPRKARVDSYPVEERYGFVWVFLGDLPEDQRPPIPDWPEFADPRYRAVKGTYEWPSNYERIVENGIDLAHPPFVHGGVFGNPERPEVPDLTVTKSAWHAETEMVTYPPKPKGLWSRMSVGKRDYKERPPVVARNAWYMPNLVRIEVNLPFGQLVIYDTNIPITETETVVKWVALRTFFKQKVFDGDTRRRVVQIFEQDKKVVTQQRPELLPFDLASELHIKSDAMAVAFRKRRRELIEMGWGIDTDRVIGDGPRTEAVVIPSPARSQVPELAHAWQHKEVPVRRPAPAMEEEIAQ